MPTPAGFGLWPISERYIPIAVGDVVNSRVTAEDSNCIDAFAGAYHCRYYRVSATNDGLLEVVLASAAMGPSYFGAPLDLYITNVTDERGKGWDPVFGPGPQLRVSAPAKHGEAYQITVWSSTVPGVEFELSSSLWPR